MISISENRDTLYWHLTGFYNCVEYARKENPDSPIGKIANDYLDNELAMENGMKEYVAFLNEISRRNHRLLNAIKTVNGKIFYKHLVEFIKEREPTEYSQFEIVSKPVGKEQDCGEYGRRIKKEWVVQRAVGDSGDSWEGTICVQIKPNKYLKFNFSM